MPDDDCWLHRSHMLGESEHFLVQPSDRKLRSDQALIAAMKYSDLENKTLREGWMDGWMEGFFFIYFERVAALLKNRPIVCHDVGTLEVCRGHYCAIPFKIQKIKVM